MAGSHPSFDPARFIDAMEFVATMGAPPDPDDQVTFYFADTIEYVSADTAGHPWLYTGDPAATGAAEPNPPIQAIVDVKVLATADDETPVGLRTPLKLALFFMPPAWAQVSAHGGFTHITYGRHQGGQKIVFKPTRTYPPTGLFEVAEHRVDVATGDLGAGGG